VASGPLTVMEVAELEDLRKELERTGRGASPLRWNANPDDVQRSVAQLVLTLVEFIRQLLERQAIRRMESGTLNEQQTEDVGQALMKLEETVRDISAKFGISPEELNLDLGPIGKLI
jgi:Gas vesicle protein K